MTSALVQQVVIILLGITGLRFSMVEA